MRLHPSFWQAGESRFLFFAGGAEAPQAPQPEAPDQNREEAKNAVAALIEQLKTDPKNVEVVQKLEIAKAEMDANKDQATCEAAVDRAASAYYRALGRGPEALAKVNTDFNTVSPGYQLKDPEGAKNFDNPENTQEKKLTPEQEKLVQNLLSIVPDPLKKAAESVIREAVSNPQTAAIAQKTFDAFQRLSQRAKVEAMRGQASKQSEALSPQIQQEVEQFKREVGPEGLTFMQRLRDGVLDAAQGQEKQDSKITPEERENALHEAEKILSDFEKISAPTELERNLVLAQLQIKGIDVREPDVVFDKGKKPEERFKMLEGSNVERGIYQLLGIVSYVVLSLQKFKETMNPEEKKKGAPGVPGKLPEGAIATGNIGKEGVRKMLKDNPGKTAADLISVKETERDASKKKIDGDEPATRGIKKDLELATGVQAAEKTKVEGLRQKASTGTEEEKRDASSRLIQAEKDYKNATTNVETLQQQLAQEQATLHRLEGEIKSIKDVQAQASLDKSALDQAIAMGKIRLAAPPGNPKLVALLEGVKIDVSENAIDLKVEFASKEARAEFLQLCDQRNFDPTKLNVEIDMIRDTILTLKDAQIFRSALDAVMAKLPEAGAAKPAS